MVKYKRKNINPVTGEPNYTDNESEYLSAITKYNQQNHVLFITERERLQILIALGWRKVAKKELLPGYETDKKYRKDKKHH